MRCPRRPDVRPRSPIADAERPHRRRHLFHAAVVHGHRVDGVRSCAGARPEGEGDTRRHALAVVDANGKLVGMVNGASSSPWLVVGVLDFGITPVVRRVGDTVVQFIVDATSLQVPVQGNPIPTDLVFPAPNCTGTPLVPVDRFSLISAVWDEADVFRYAILPGSPRTWESIAFFITDGSPCSGTLLPGGRCCVNKPGGPKNLADTALFDLSAIGLVVPFHVEGP
jgi:hypothetical protein